MSRAALADILLRIGLSFSFLYPPIDALFHPDSWIGYFPRLLRGNIPDIYLLHGFGLLEVSIALWILSGKKIAVPASLAALILLAIVLTNMSELEVVFRDISLAFVAAALAITHYFKVNNTIL